MTVQRYLNGGNNYRSYRILSSPVYSGTAGSNNVYTINYLQNSMYLTGNAGGGFDKTGNPTLYLYREDLTPSNATFTSGNFLGISAINNTPAYNYYLNGGSTPYSLPAASGLLCFFRGSRAAATVAAETTLGYVPVTTTLSTTGLLNQGTIAAHNWYTPSSVYLPYTTVNPGNSPVRGYNMAGNPYPSSIDWSKFSATSSSAAIYGPNVSPAIYEFDPVTHNYGTYNAVTGISTGNGGKIIASGEGFFVQALNGSATLTFSEAAKTSTQATGSSLLFALRRDSNISQNQSQDGYGSYMRLKLETDTINYSDMVIGFKPDARDGFNPGEDSAFLPGVGGSKGSVAAIGSDNIKAAAKWLALPPGNTGKVVKLSVNVSANGTYTLKRTDLQSIPAIYDVWLMDKYKKDSLDIKHNTSYIFDANLSDTATFGNNRFAVVIRQNTGLALHLLSFAAAKSASGAQLTWKVENEANYTNFYVERSTDSTTFSIAGRIFLQQPGHIPLYRRPPGTACRLVQA